jgi:hypothetical protein|nr:nitroreductase family protein [uncultured Oscillibacter sp.]
MTLEEAMRTRHTVRRYTDRKIPGDILEQLRERIRRNNEEHGLAMSLVTENTEAFGPALKLFLAKGVRNYVILAGGPGLDEKIGYCGADVMLFAQALGLNSWWVGGTYSRKGLRKNAAPEAEKILGLLALGYGAVQGVPHKSKRPGEVASYEGEAPEWFAKGVEALLLAPTALNRQTFTLRGEGRRVSLACDGGAFAGVDLGIGKYHFELGAGKGNFDWA